MGVIFKREDRICVGFGQAALTRDGEVIWQEAGYKTYMRWDDLMTGARAEEIASRDPGHDWRIVLNAPFLGVTFQRQADGQWGLIEQNDGFA